MPRFPNTRALKKTGDYYNRYLIPNFGRKMADRIMARVEAGPDNFDTKAAMQINKYRPANSLIARRSFGVLQSG